MLTDIIPPLTGGETTMFHSLPVYTINQSQEAQLQNNPQGQKLCGKGKMRVLLFKDQVVKGPYLESQSKYLLNLINTQSLQELEDKLNLPDKLRSSLAWTGILQIKNRRYLLAPNVGDPEIVLMPQEEADTSVEQGRMVAQRGSYIDSIGGLLREEVTLSESVLVATLQHFYFRYLLGIGDSNLNQVLLRRDKTSRLIAGIDMEEKRSREASGKPLNLLFSKPPSKKTGQLLVKYLGDIRQFTDQNPPPLLTPLIQKRMEIFKESLGL